MKILLVNPTTSYQAGFRKYAVFPYGILFIAAVLEKAGHEVTVYDNNIDRRTPEDFISFNPGLIGFSVLTGRSIENAVEQSKRFRAIFPRARIVWGGVHPSLLPEQTVVEPFIDYVVVGEGEYTLLELVACLEEGKTDVSAVRGLVFEQGDKIVKNAARPFIKNLDELPDPAWHLVDVGRYSAVTLNTSRGCPFRCTFCYNQTFNRGRRSDFSAERVVSWVELFKKNYGTTVFKFYEDNFVVARKRLKAFCNLLIDRKLEVKWECESRVDLTEEEISLMARSGCHAVGLGVESGSPRMLEFLKKDISLEKVERFCKMLVRHGIGPGIYVMAGLPTETAEELDMTARLLDRLDFKWCEYMIYRPYPGTELYDYCIRHHLFDPPERLSDWINFSDLYDTENSLKNIPREVLDKNLKKFRNKYMLRPLIFMIRHDTRNFIKKMLDPKKIFLGLNFLLESYVELIKYRRKT